jgi:hypothetical protein
VITRELLDAACAAYFIDAQPTVAPPPPPARHPAAPAPVRRAEVH